MEQSLVIALTHSGGTVAATPSQNSILLNLGDVLVVSMDLEAGLSIPHLLKSEYTRQGTSSVFSIGNGQTMAAGIEFSQFWIQNIGGSTGFADVCYSGTVTDSALVVQPWSVTFQLQLDEQSLAPGLTASSSCLFTCPPAPLQFSIEVDLDPLNSTLPEAHGPLAPHLGPYILYPGQLLIFQVSSGTGVANAGFTEITYFEAAGGTEICSLSLGMDAAPAGLAMPRFAFRNNGILPAAAEYVEYMVTFRGLVEIGGTVRMWSFDPEIILRTSGGEPTCP